MCQLSHNQCKWSSDGISRLNWQHFRAWEAGWCGNWLTVSRFTPGSRINTTGSAHGAGWTVKPSSTCLSVRWGHCENHKTTSRASGIVQSSHSLPYSSMTQPRGFGAYSLDFISMGWRGCASAIKVIKTPSPFSSQQNHYVINLYFAT